LESCIPGKEKIMTNSKEVIFVPNEDIPVYTEILDLKEKFYTGPLSPLPEEKKKQWREAIDCQKEILDSSLKNCLGCMVYMNEKEMSILLKLIDHSAELFYCPTRNLLQKFISDALDRRQQDPNDPNLISLRVLALYVMIQENLDSKIKTCHNLMDNINETYEYIRKKKA
jgi:hypothetical protein